MLIHARHQHICIFTIKSAPQEVRKAFERHSSQMVVSTVCCASCELLPQPGSGALKSL